MKRDKLTYYCLIILTLLISGCDTSSVIKLRTDDDNKSFKAEAGANLVAAGQPMKQTAQGFYVEASAGSYISRGTVRTPRGYIVHHGVEHGAE